MKRFEKKSILILLIVGFTAVLNLNAAFAKPVNPTAIPLRNKINGQDSSIKLKGGVKIDHDKQIITLSVKDSDLKQVLRMMADKAGMNVMIHDSVTGTISLDLIEVDLNKAFEYIMTVKSLTYWKDGNTLIIADKNTAKTLSLNIAQIKAIKIKYVDAQRVANFLNKNIFTLNRPNTSTSSIVTTNPHNNEVLIFGSDDDIQLAEEVIKYLDAKPQVKSFTVNYASPLSLASKICWAVFKSSKGEQSFTKEADLKEGSEAKIICGNTMESDEKSNGSDLEDFKTASYWVLADTGLNQITIYGGTSEQLNMAQEIITNFDKKEPQIYLEISIVELSEDGSKSLASTWNYEKGSTSWDFADGRVLLNPVDNLGTNKLLTWEIQSLITQNKGRVLANPRIIAANNVTSKVKISSQVVQTREVEIDRDADTVTSNVSVGDGDTIEFSILPKVSPNNYVTLSLTGFTFNTIKGTVEDAEGNLIATLTNSRDVETKQVRVKDGDTFIIGGLIQETETITHKKTPVLADIPVIGVFFQNQATGKTRSELIIMITPRIIVEDDDLEPV
ncbi:MAG TPA: secretin N-terminal domain-containing protein [Candidatus Gastranaerophilales bacterium]|nr:secretin N-terminal domain-containing protein [Candidatus Gastranaerophilales bacterium]